MNYECPGEWGITTKVPFPRDDFLFSPTGEITTRTFAGHVLTRFTQASRMVLQIWNIDQINHNEDTKWSCVYQTKIDKIDRRHSFYIDLRVETFLCRLTKSPGHALFQKIKISIFETWENVLKSYTLEIRVDFPRNNFPEIFEACNVPKKIYKSEICIPK